MRAQKSEATRRTMHPAARLQRQRTPSRCALGTATKLAVTLASMLALGATAAQSVFGKITPINKTRGRLIDLDDGVKALVTVHPSYLLRLPDEEAKAQEYERFVGDLKIAAELLRKSAHAA